MKNIIQIVALFFISFGLNAQIQQNTLEVRKPTTAFEVTMGLIKSDMVSLDAQASASRKTRNTNKALQAFLETPFMEKFKEIKIEAESQVATFKVHARNFSPEDVARVRKGYAKIAEEFNGQLIEVKNDLMDKNTVKLLKSRPEIYSNSLGYKLRELKDSYSNNFEKLVFELTGSETYSAAPLIAIISLIKMAVDFTNYIANANGMAKMENENMLREFLIEPYRFKTWDEIQMGEGELFQNNENYSPSQEYTDPPQVDTGTINLFEETKKTESSAPKRKKN